MSQRRGYNNGIIRPRPLSTNYRKTDKDMSIKFSTKTALLVMIVTFGAVFIFAAGSAMFRAESDGTVAKEIAPVSQGVRGSVVSKSEDNDSYEDDPGEDSTAGEDALEDAEEDEDDDAAGAEDEQEDSAEQDEEDSGMEEPIESSEEEAESVAVTPKKKKSGNPLRLNLFSYFNNAGKKHAMMETSGSFKYIMAEITDYEGRTALVVQGCPGSIKKCYHSNAAQTLENEVKTYDISMKVLGGGRITWHGLRKSKRKLGVISIFGYSKTYGACDDCNRKACEIIFKQFPDYVVKYSNQGYTEKDEYKIRDFVKCSD